MSVFTTFAGFPCDVFTDNFPEFAWPVSVTAVSLVVALLVRSKMEGKGQLLKLTFIMASTIAIVSAVIALVWLVLYFGGSCRGRVIFWQ